ncbi:hypothetical protein ACF0H5_019367 [Mactra antiquata]
MENKEPSMDNSSEETFDFICTNCDDNGKIVEAVRYCIECSGYCCQTCTDLHHTFVMMKGHNLLDASQGNQASNQPSSLPEFPTERCNLHTGKVIDMYCEEHNEVCCCTCIATHHKSCPENSIKYIPDMIDTLFKLGESKEIQCRLRDTLDSMTAIGKSKDDKLEALKDMKNEEIEKVINFMKALEAIIRKAAEATRKEIESKYKELEKDILQEKQDVNGYEVSLKESCDKLKTSERNRAQSFVRSKTAEKKVKEVDSKISKQKLRNNDGIEYTFTPNQSLMKYLNGLHGIGIVGVSKKERKDLYKITWSRDINIKVAGDSKQCDSVGCCLTFDNQLLVTDYNNKSLKLIDTHTMTVIDVCKLDSQPFGVCCITDDEAVVACSSNKIQFVSYGYKMKPTRQIKTSHTSYGITTKNDKIYVTDCLSSPFIYDMAGNLLKTISQNVGRNTLFCNSRHVTSAEKGDKMYVSDSRKGVVCFDGEDNFQSIISDIDLCLPDGVCVDGRGNIFVVGFLSHNVVQFNENGKKIGVVIKQDGLQQTPRSICFDQTLNRLFVTMQHSDVVKMFELY